VGGSSGKNKMKSLLIILLALGAAGMPTAAQDALADNMLLFQRSSGGWPKHINEVKLDYSKVLSPQEKEAVLGDRNRNDATIDNQATTKEIRHLVKAYAKSGNSAYREAAERGVRYLLAMQYPNGGFPQFYPDTSGYRNRITYNDNAMINALAVLRDVGCGLNGFDKLDAALTRPATKAVERGIDCILKTQIKSKGKLTAWCAQYHHRTLQPVKARSFELASISGSESVGIIQFLMEIEKPTPAVRTAILSAVEWLEAVKISGFRFEDIDAPGMPNGKDRVLVPDPDATVWARFYDIETNKPFFTGRDGIKRASLAEVEHERRTGYAWYGTWPEALLRKHFPAWCKKQGVVR
jgi:PelA/Pel-15E family pectate lyase